MTTRKQPQDHRPKNTAPKTFEFTGRDGKTYRLPPAQSVLEDEDGELTLGDFMDAMTAGEYGQMMLAFRVLEVIDVDDRTKKALRGLSLTRGAEVVGEWFNFESPQVVSIPQ